MIYFLRHVQTGLIKIGVTRVYFARQYTLTREYGMLKRLVRGVEFERITMEKKIGYEAIIEVDGFRDASRWIYRMIDAGIVECGQCEQPATHVFWQDQAEFYCRCNQHWEYGEQWTGSTRWNPQSFGMYVRSKEAAEEWRSTLTTDEQGRVKIESFDATNYWSLLDDDRKSTRHYLAGSEDVDGFKAYADIYLLKNGEYAYEFHKAWLHGVNGTVRGYGLKGSWASEELALEAARADFR